jgi:glucose-1-phosphate cytidylyltransferase
MDEKMPVVILCGGKGTRLYEETVIRPKPLIDVGHRPILWHIMKTYAQYGFTDFILCLGYKGAMIKDYFLNYEMINNDFTITLGREKKLEVHSAHGETEWNVTLIDTGDDSMTGSRVKRIEKHIRTEYFMLTYGDGLANVPIDRLVDFHMRSGLIGTVTGVHPSSRFGGILSDGKKVKCFSEKPQITQGIINGGFFVFKKEFMRYLSADESCYLEREPLERLAEDGQLGLYLHDGFWQCMDTYRELELLNALWKSGQAPWKTW